MPDAVTCTDTEPIEAYADAQLVGPVISITLPSSEPNQQKFQVAIFDNLDLLQKLGRFEESSDTTFRALAAYLGRYVVTPGKRRVILGMLKNGDVTLNQIADHLGIPYHLIHDLEPVTKGFAA